MARARLKGWRFVAFFGSFVGAILTPLYFTAYRPYVDSSYWKQIREQTVTKLPPTKF